MHVVSREWRADVSRPIAGSDPAVAGLFLCEAFDSFRGAACAAGVPRWLTHTVPDVWVVHSDGDRLFPLEMPRRIANACGSWGELIVVEGLAHN